MSPLFPNKTVVFLLGILFLLTAACGGSAPESAPPEVISEPAGDQPAATEVPPTQAAPVDEPLGGSPDNPIPFAETLLTPDWEVQVLEVQRSDKAHEDADMEYVFVHLRVKYVGTEASAYVYGKMFRGTGSANEIYKATSFIDVTAPDPELEADLASGGEAEGWVAIQARKDEAGLMLVLWPYVSYENNTAMFSEATPKWFLSLNQ
ncbi:MAG: hypothetical protein QY332_14920 [Anaerolineales bacterium]|nr:MAG: hypothetical protein QY332_14920 [Anaerolineales bacterium]